MNLTEESAAALVQDIVADARELVRLEAAHAWNRSMARVSRSATGWPQSSHTVDDDTRGAAADDGVTPHPRVKIALFGAAAGSAVCALALFVAHRRRERNRTLNVLRRTWRRWTAPPRQRSVLGPLVGSSLRALASKVAAESIYAALANRRHDATDHEAMAPTTGESPAPSAVEHVRERLAREWGMLKRTVRRTFERLTDNEVGDVKGRFDPNRTDEEISRFVSEGGGSACYASGVTEFSDVSSPAPSRT